MPTKAMKALDATTNVGFYAFRKLRNLIILVAVFTSILTCMLFAGAFALMNR